MIEIGGVTDHVHMLVILKPTILLADFMRELKSCSSKWVNEIMGDKFEWQNGYGAFTVGKSQVPNVRRYIRNQEQHHRTVNFRAEFVDLLERAGVDHDEKYLWR